MLNISFLRNTAQTALRPNYRRGLHILALLLASTLGLRLLQPALAASPPGTVIAWGSDFFEEQLKIPAGLRGVTAIAIAHAHSLALKRDGTVVAWGSNNPGRGSGQTNVPSGLSGVTAIAANGYHSLALKSDGTVVAWGWNDDGQTNVPSGLSGVTAISAGFAHSLALKRDGTVVAWGCGQNVFNSGQCNVPSGLSGVTAIAAGGDQSLALKSDGTVVAWGCGQSDSNYGQCNVPSGLSGVTAIAAGDYQSLALKSDGTVVAWGLNVYGETNVPAGLSGVTAIAAGLYHNLALKSDGTVIAWGANHYGQASVPAGLSSVSAIAASGYNSLALVPSPPDATSPVITAAVVGTLGNNGWYVSDVAVNFTCADEADGSGLATNTVAGATLTTDGLNQSVTNTGQCIDNAGNVATVVSVSGLNIDKTPPTLTPVVSPNPVVLGGTATLTAGATDALSGLASQSCGTLDTSSVGSKSVTCTATDNAGNTANPTVNYTVAYPWTGFLQPVDNYPTINTVNAGQAIPVKFSLGGNFGLNIFASSYPKVQMVACGSNSGSGGSSPIEETVTAGNSTLQYAATQTYTYIWKTDKAWAGTCRQLIVRLVDGVDHIALFQFNGKVRSANADQEAGAQQVFLPLINR